MEWLKDALSQERHASHSPSVCNCWGCHIGLVLARYLGSNDLAAVPLDCDRRSGSGFLRLRGGEPEGHLLRTEHRVFAPQNHGSGLLFGADPDGSGSSDEGKWVVADDFGRPIEFKNNGVVCEGPNLTVLVIYAKDDPSRI
jgi:hypothetical protein